MEQENPYRSPASMDAEMKIPTLRATVWRFTWLAGKVVFAIQAVAAVAIWGLFLGLHVWFSYKFDNPLVRPGGVGKVLSLLGTTVVLIVMNTAICAVAGAIIGLLIGSVRRTFEKGKR